MVAVPTCDAGLTRGTPLAPRGDPEQDETAEPARGACEAIAHNRPRPGHSVLGQGTFRDAEDDWRTLALGFADRAEAGPVELTLPLDTSGYDGKMKQRAPGVGRVSRRRGALHSSHLSTEAFSRYRRS